MSAEAFVLSIEYITECILFANKSCALILLHFSQSSSHGSFILGEHCQQGFLTHEMYHAMRLYDCASLHVVYDRRVLGTRNPLSNIKSTEEQ